MSLAVTEFGKRHRMFTWRIVNVDQIELSDFKASPAYMNHGYSYQIESPEMTAIDPYNGTVYNIKLSLSNSRGKPPFDYLYISLENNDRLCFSIAPFEFYYQINNSEVKKGKYISSLNENVKTLTIFLDLPVKINEVISPPKSLPYESLADRLKEKMWKNDSSLKFTIECGDTSIETYKPFLAAASPSFEAMFKTNCIEARDNCMTIPDFAPQTVQKMIEFCETDNIKDIDGLELELSHIAHKYLMKDLINYISNKMIQTVTFYNYDLYLQLTEMYDDLNEFKEWLLKTGKSVHKV